MSINSPVALSSDISSFLDDDSGQANKLSLVEQESWLISYVDLLLLMVTLFVLLLSYQQSELDSKALNPEDQVVVKETTREQIDVAPSMTNKAFLDQIYVSDLKDRVSVNVDDDRVKLEINDNILFLPGDATLSVTGGEVIDELALMLRERNWNISVEGHTDNQPISTPRFPSNWELSSARASKVTRRLISRGISSKRLSAIGYADTRPANESANLAERAKNRRVTLVLSVLR